MSADPEQEYFADGIVDDIITAQSHFKALFVIARNSSFTYKGEADRARARGAITPQDPLAPVYIEPERLSSGSKVGGDVGATSNCHRRRRDRRLGGRACPAGARIERHGL